MVAFTKWRKCGEAKGKEDTGRGGGSRTRVECALNNLYDTEQNGRVGRCTYYQDYDRAPAKVVKTGWMCTECSVGLHQECYYDYHRVVHGVILADEYEMNKVRGSRKTLMKVPNGIARIRHYRVPRDHRDGYSCESEGSHDQFPLEQTRCHMQVF